MRHELGCTSQRARADAAALRFRNNVLSLDENEHVVRQVYRELQGEEGPTGSGVTKNSVTGFLEPLAESAGWERPVGLPEAKKFSKEYVNKALNEEFKKDLKEKSTLANMAIWACEERRGLPEYMKRPCPIGLRDGRRWKTKLRLGRHQLQSSLAVRERGRDQSETRDYACKFCNLHVDETAEHALMECQGHDDERESFLA